MARAFEITAAANRVQLGANRKAQTAFTVSNVLGRPMRGRVKVVAEEGAEAGWFTVAGPEVRDFAAGATDQVRVDLAVPAGVAEGDYPFRLDVVAEENPDELSARGQSVHLQVPASEAPKKPFPWWIVAVAAAVLVAVVAVVLWLVLADSGVDVPDVEGRPADVAQALLENAGFVVEVETDFETQEEPGTVLGREPAGDSLEEGSTVTLRVAGRIDAPPLGGKSLAEARQLLQEQGLRLTSAWEEPGGTGVVNQHPGAGERIDPGGGVGVLLGVKDTWVKARAELSLNRGEAVDVDEGALNSGAKDDFVYRARNGQTVLDPRNGATLARIEGDDLATETVCKGASYDGRQQPLEDLPVGAQLCVKSRENRFARIRLTEGVTPDEPVELQFTTWMRQDERPTIFVPGVIEQFRPLKQMELDRSTLQLLEKSRVRERVFENPDPNR